MQANEVKEAIVLRGKETCEGVTVLTTDCSGYDDFRTLPSVVVYEGCLYGKTGWNSDRGVAYFRSDAHIALGVK